MFIKENLSHAKANLYSTTLISTFLFIYTSFASLKTSDMEMMHNAILVINGTVAEFNKNSYW